MWDWLGVMLGARESDKNDIVEHVDDVKCHGSTAGRDCPWIKDDTRINIMIRGVKMEC